MNGRQDCAGVAIEAVLGPVVADFTYCLARDLRVINLGLGGDFARDNDQARSQQGLARDA